MIYLQMPKVDGKPGNHYLNFIDNGQLISLPVWTLPYLPIHDTIDNDLGRRLRPGAELFNLADDLAKRFKAILHAR